MSSEPEDKHPILTGELARRLGVSPHTVVGFVKMFQMKGHDEYHTTTALYQEFAT